MNRLPFLCLLLIAVGCEPKPVTNRVVKVNTIQPLYGSAATPEPEARVTTTATSTAGPAATPAATPAALPATLAEARKGFRTRLVPVPGDKEPVEVPPAGAFQLIKYEAPVGKLQAYLTPDPKDGKKHPAIVWITGNDCNSIDDVWSPVDPEDDQTASAYRKAGIVMMFPSLRGGNDNPGFREGFFGEVDDVLAAADFLSKQPYVDPARIYLGGHSTGGTLALLVAECSDRFRAVFSFGPVDNVSEYHDEDDPGFLPFDLSNWREVRVRSPGYWLDSIRSPVFVFEGADEEDEEGCIDCLRKMARSTRNPYVRFFPVQGADHFTILTPVNQWIAQKVLRDDGAQTNLAFTESELNHLLAR
jgi:acetyl esterase/lipase